MRKNGIAAVNAGSLLPPIPVLFVYLQGLQTDGEIFPSHDSRLGVTLNGSQSGREARSVLLQPVDQLPQTAD